MNFCPSCGEKLPPNSRFCSGCGRTLREADGVKLATTPRGEAIRGILMAVGCVSLLPIGLLAATGIGMAVLSATRHEPGTGYYSGCGAALGAVMISLLAWIRGLWMNASLDAAVRTRKSMIVAFIGTLFLLSVVGLGFFIGSEWLRTGFDPSK